MLLALAGALSTGEIGLSLAEMIRQGKVHAVCCTGANLEEDVFNLLAHSRFLRVPHYRELTAADEAALLARGMNRVTDTCIPEDVIRRLERLLLPAWAQAAERGLARFPHEFFFDLMRDPQVCRDFDIDPADSWVYAAAHRDLPLFVPGWEDSSMGMILAACVMDRRLPHARMIRPGLDYLIALADWYTATCATGRVGFFQIGGGIAGDFAISVVPTLRQDLGREVPPWAYFCQISDSTTSYGSYSGAVPNEKITWGKLSPDTPRFIIESDASIVAPLIFACVLGW